jgi:hypothetical protein
MGIASGTRPSITSFCNTDRIHQKSSLLTSEWLFNFGFDKRTINSDNHKAKQCNCCGATGYKNIECEYCGQIVI